RAKDALAAGDIAKACADFAESQRLDPAAGTLLNLADCEERQGKLATAWQHFAEARDKLPRGGFRHPLAQERIDALAPRVPHLTLRLEPGAPADARAFRDGVELGLPSLGLALPIDPGKHVLVVRASGFADAPVEYVADPGEQRVMTLSMGRR